MTPFVWMFLSSYKDLRIFITQKNTITSLTQLEYSGFEGWQQFLFVVLQSKRPQNHFSKGCILDYLIFEVQKIKALKLLKQLIIKIVAGYFEAISKQFEDIPGSPDSLLGF